MKKLSERKINLIETLIKEELQKAIDGGDLSEGIMSSLAAKAKGMGAKVAAKGGNIGTTFKLAAAAAKGDQKSIANLASQLKDVNLEGELKQAESIINSFQKQMVVSLKSFMEDLARGGFTAMPGVADVIDNMSGHLDYFENNMKTEMMQGLQSGIQKTQQVAKKAGADAGGDGKAAQAAQAKDSPISLPSGIKPGSKEEIALLQKRLKSLEDEKDDAAQGGATGAMARNAASTAKDIFDANS